MMYNLSVSAARLETHMNKRDQIRYSDKRICVFTVKFDSLMKLQHLLLTRTFFRLGEKNDFIFISLAAILNSVLVMLLIQIYELSVEVSNIKSMLHSMSAGLFQRRRIR